MNGVDSLAGKMRPVVSALMVLTEDDADELALLLISKLARLSTADLSAAVQ